MVVIKLNTNFHLPITHTDPVSMQNLPKNRASSNYHETKVVSEEWCDSESSVFSEVSDQAKEVSMDSCSPLSDTPTKANYTDLNVGNHKNQDSKRNGHVNDVEDTMSSIGSEEAVMPNPRSQGTQESFRGYSSRWKKGGKERKKQKFPTLTLKKAKSCSLVSVGTGSISELMDSDQSADYDVINNEKFNPRSGTVSRSSEGSNSTKQKPVTTAIDEHGIFRHQDVSSQPPTQRVNSICSSKPYSVAPELVSEERVGQHSEKNMTRNYFALATPPRSSSTFKSNQSGIGTTNNSTTDMNQMQHCFLPGSRFRKWTMSTDEDESDLDPIDCTSSNEILHDLSKSEIKHQLENQLQIGNNRPVMPTSNLLYKTRNTKKTFISPPIITRKVVEDDAISTVTVKMSNVNNFDTERQDTKTRSIDLFPLPQSSISPGLIKSTPLTLPEQKSSKTKGVLRKTFPKIKKILLGTSSGNIIGDASHSAANSNVSSPSRIDTTPSDWNDNSKLQQPERFKENARENVLMGSPLCLKATEDAGQTPGSGGIVKRVLGNQNRKRVVSEDFRAKGNSPIRKMGSFVLKRGGMSRVAAGCIEDDEDFTNRLERGWTRVPASAADNKSSNLLKNVHQQADDAIRGRLDGIDLLSLGTARSVSYISPKQRRFAGQRYTLRSMVTDVLIGSCGKNPPEIVLEGFSPSAEDRWLVCLEDSKKINCKGVDENSSSKDVKEETDDDEQFHSMPLTVRESWDDSEQLKGCTNSQRENSHQTLSLDMSLSSQLRLDEDDEDYENTSSEDDDSSSEKLPTYLLLAQIWGKDNPPPPTHLPRIRKKDNEDDVDYAMTNCSCPVDVDEDIFLFDSPDHLQSVHDIGAFYLKNWKFDKAVDIFDKILRSLKSRYAIKGGQHFLVGSALHNLGIVQMWAGRYEDSLETLKMAVQVRSNSLSFQHPAIAVSLAKLGTAYFALEQLDNALECFEKAMKIRKLVLQRDHLEMAKLSNNIGVTYYQKGENTKANKYLTEALKIQQQWINSPIRRENLVHDVSMTQCNLGKVYLEREDYDMAFYVYEEALLLQTTAFKKDHDVVLMSLGNIAYAKAKKGEKTNALQIYKSVHRSQVSKFGPESREAAETKGLMGVIHIQQCNYKQAQICFMDVLKWQKENLDEFHSAIKNTKKTIRKLKQARRGEVSVWL